MKTPQQLLAEIERRLTRTWAATLAGPDSDAGEQAWPWAFALGQPTGNELSSDFGGTVRQVTEWREWAAEHRLALGFRARRVMGTAQELPTHVHVPDLDAAAALCGNGWQERIARGRRRATVLRGRYPHLLEPSRTLAAVDAISDVDFDLLCHAADWFAIHDATGLTPRQVPIEGLHAKWLNTRNALVRDLAGLEDLRLLPPHPARLHFTYLDPGYRAMGRRIHDSATVGDQLGLAYRPQFVVISENKDTAIHLPAVPGGVSIEGVGRGGGAAAAFDWITGAPAVFYWGDMDADGLEILDGFRAAGIPATSILMDPTAYQQWERFGTNEDARGRPLQARPAKPVPYLTDAETTLYQQLIAPDWTRPRRIEQERIPLNVAVGEVDRHLRSLHATRAV